MGGSSPWLFNNYLLRMFDVSDSRDPAVNKTGKSLSLWGFHSSWVR